MPAGAKTQVRFGVNSDNRGGTVTVQVGGESDPRTNSYNTDPGENPYGKIERRLSETDGAGSKQVSATLVTSSEFVEYSKGGSLPAWSGIKSRYMIDPVTYIKMHGRQDVGPRGAAEDAAEHVIERSETDHGVAGSRD